MEDKSCLFFWLGIEGKKERSEANKDDEGNRRLFCNTLKLKDSKTKPRGEKEKEKNTGFYQCTWALKTGNFRRSKIQKGSFPSLLEDPEMKSMLCI